MSLPRRMSSHGCRGIWCRRQPSDRQGWWWLICSRNQRWTMQRPLLTELLTVEGCSCTAGCCPPHRWWGPSFDRLAGRTIRSRGCREPGARPLRIASISGRQYDRLGPARHDSNATALLSNRSKMCGAAMKCCCYADCWPGSSAAVLTSKQVRADLRRGELRFKATHRAMTVDGCHRGARSPRCRPRCVDGIFWPESLARHNSRAAGALSDLALHRYAWHMLRSACYMTRTDQRVSKQASSDVIWA